MNPRLLLLPLVVACGSPAANIPATNPAEASHADVEPEGRVDYQAELPPAPPGDLSEFAPPARDAYPEGPFGDAVRRGERLFTDTPSVAGDYMGNHLSCSNCHLDDGRRPDSAPMWAAWVKYPAYRKKNDHVNSMEERLRGCFTYSLDAQHSAIGHAPEPGDPMLTDLQAYMYWLATGAPTGANMPGRGYPKLDAPEQPHDAGRGAVVYADRCEVCHGADGAGQSADGGVVFPPLWGAESYNWGAGMHRVNTAAGFIYANMPLGQPETLTPQEAWDVAAYINSKPRPEDPRAKGGGDVDGTYHDHDCAYGDEDRRKQVAEASR